MAYLKLPSVSLLRKTFDYDAASGLLTRKKLDKIVPAYNKRGYVLASVFHKNYAAHRIIWKICTGKDPGNFMVDHINGNSLDNRFENLRLVTPSENQKARRHQKSGRRAKELLHFQEFSKRMREA